MNCCLRQDHKHLGCLLHGLSDGHCGCCCSNWRSLTRIEPLPVCRSISSLAARETRVQTLLAGVAEADLECKMSMKTGTLTKRCYGLLRRSWLSMQDEPADGEYSLILLLQATSICSNLPRHRSRAIVVRLHGMLATGRAGSERHDSAASFGLLLSSRHSLHNSFATVATYNRKPCWGRSGSRTFPQCAK